MEFRAPSVATELNNKAVKYLTESLADPESGQRALEGVMLELGNATDGHPDWHPILTKPESGSTQHIAYLSQVEAYDGIDHTVEFRQRLSCGGGGK